MNEEVITERVKQVEADIKEIKDDLKTMPDKIAEKIGADIIRIEPVKAYPDKGAKKFIWGGKSAVMGEKPALQPYEFSIEQYDRIILGTPVWASNFAPPIRTFIKENPDIHEKKIAVFTCFSGGGADKAIEKMKKYEIEFSQGVEETQEDKVRIMTIHKSKGLEFPYVFVAGMEENIFPSGGFMASESEIEEERRLFYVAMTRAKKILQLSFASSRLRNGKTESNSPSRFIREVDRKYISNPLEPKDDDRDDDKPSSSFSWGRPAGSRNRFGQGGYSYGTSGPVKTEKSRPAPVARPVRPSAPSPVPVSRTQVVPKRVSDAEFEPTPILQLKAGQRIEHNRFGFGQILEITGQVPDLKARISFDEHGEKILLLKYAKIRVINLA